MANKFVERPRLTMAHAQIDEAVTRLARALDALPKDIIGPVVKKRRSRRYCAPCDRYVPARETECKLCGADTDKVPTKESR